MAECKERPRAGAPPRLDESKEILLELLNAERARLKVALRIEEERKIVFPETSVIIRDIQKLTTAVYGKDDAGESGGDKNKGNPDFDLGFKMPKLG